jgi:hypothetical protein
VGVSTSVRSEVGGDGSLVPGARPSSTLPSSLSMWYSPTAGQSGPWPAALRCLLAGPLHPRPPLSRWYFHFSGLGLLGGLSNGEGKRKTEMDK